MNKLKLLVILIILLPTISLGKTRILFIGDSITDGAWGNSSGSAKPSSERNLWDMNHIYGHGYMYLCAAYYQAKYPTKEYEFFNRGISGNTLSDLEKRWTEDVLKMKADVLSILIGTNDVGVSIKKRESFDIKNWEKRYRHLLDISLKTNPNLKFVLCSPFVAYAGKMKECKEYEEYKTLIEYCAKAVKRIAKDYNAVYLPFNSMFEKVIKKTPNIPNSYWIWDGIHPTAAGHKLMSEMWIKAVNKKCILQ